MHAYCVDAFKRISHAAVADVFVSAADVSHHCGIASRTVTVLLYVYIIIFMTAGVPYIDRSQNETLHADLQTPVSAPPMPVMTRVGTLRAVHSALAVVLLLATSFGHGGVVSVDPAARKSY